MNFGYVSDPWVNLDIETGVNFYSPESFKSFLDLMKDLSVRNVLKSHHSFGFYRELMDVIQEQFCILYIYREPIAVLKSLQRYLMGLPGLRALRNLNSISSFL